MSFRVASPRLEAPHRARRAPVWRGRLGALLGWCLAALWLAASALAEPPPPAQAPPQPAPVMPAAVPSKVEVGVMAIQASPEPGPSDPRLAPIRAQLEALPFESFKLVDAREVTLRDGGEEDLKLAGGRMLTLHLVSHDDKQAQVRVELASHGAKVLDSTIRVHRNRTFNLAVRTSGGALVIPITVSY